MNKPKRQGTAWETAIVKAAEAQGFIAERLAEGGSRDVGDIRIIAGTGYRIIVEAKHAGALNLHDALAKAVRKAAPADPDVTAVAWKRLIRKDGKQRRVAAGPPVVAMTLDDFLWLLRGL